MADGFCLDGWNPLCWPLYVLGGMGGCGGNEPSPIDTDTTDTPPDTLETDTGVPVDIIDDTVDTNDTGFWDSFETQPDSGQPDTNTAHDTQPDTIATQPIDNDGDHFYANGYYDGNSFVDCSNPSQQLAQICRTKVDCDDTKNFVHPESKEFRDHLDNNCNGTVDDINHEPGGDTVMWVGQTPIDTQLGGTSSEMSLGDVDGDGKVDVLINDTTNNLICGSLGNGNHIVQGNVNQVPNDCDFTIAVANGYYRIEQVTAYDWDRDGKDDISFTIPGFSDANGITGALVTMYGRDVYQNYNLTIDLLNNKDQLKSSAWQMFRMKGSVSEPIERFVIGKDIDNDGRPELIFPMHIQKAIIIPADAYIGTTNIESVLNTAGYGGYWIHDSFFGSYFGRDPISTGDVNGDGYAELLACNSDDFPNGYGKCNLLNGKTLPKYPTIVDINDLTQTPQAKYVKISATSGTSHAGGSNLVVDLDYDGLADVIIGNVSDTIYGTNAGEAYWIPGSYLKSMPWSANIIMNDDLLSSGAAKIVGITPESYPGNLAVMAGPLLIWANNGYHSGQGIAALFSAESVINQAGNVMTLNDASLQLMCGFGGYGQGLATSLNPSMAQHLLISAPQAENSKGRVYLVPGSPLQ